MINPELENRCKFNNDVVTRAHKYMSSVSSVGAYTQSQGIPAVRQEIADFLNKRDNKDADINNIFLCNGASEGVKHCLQSFIREPSKGVIDGILAPIPQYPLYSAQLTLLGGHLMPYHLDEANNWDCSIDSINNSYNNAKKQNIDVRGIVVINPGNPTGQVMSEKSMRNVIDFCRKNNVYLMADEVYQENIWKNNSKFISFRKIANEMKAFDKNSNFQLVTLHSTSKGFLGECGLRGGFFELLGFDEEVKAEILKLASISLCPNTIGQITTGLMVNPPKEGDASYSIYIKERDDILKSLKKRADILHNALNKLSGISCNSIDGAMYAFPTITLPPKLINYAKSIKQEADAIYCMQLLERTGLVVVPGSGFGQKENTFHFRTTILPPEEDMQEVITKFSNFHNTFLKEYA